MSTSGVTDYSVTELDILEEAASHIGVLQDGQPLKASEVVVLRRKLNMLVKQWVAQADFAPGLKMWTRRRAYLFLSSGQVEYDIGPNGDECAAETYVLTSLSAGGGTSFTLESGDGISVDDRLGVVTDSGLIWTTVTSIGGNVVDVEDSISASVGAVVFAYTSKPLKPFEIVSGLVRDSEGQDSPVDVNLSVTEYELISGKSTEGTPFRLYAEARKDAMRVYLDCAPDDTSKVIRLVYQSYIEDSTAQTQDVDFPGEWFRALAAQVAMDSAPAFGRPVPPELKMLRDESLRMAQNAHPSKSSAYYVSEPDCY